MLSDTSNPNVPESSGSTYMRREIWLALAVLVLASVISYHNSFSGVMVFDDRPSITRNDSIKNIWDVGKVLRPPNDNTVSGRPVANVTLAINYAFGELRPWGYHVANLVIHLSAGLLLFGVMRRTFELPSLMNRFGAVAVPLALSIAVLWTVHPLQTESVTYIIQRVEALMGLFYLLTIYCFVRSLDTKAPGKWQVATVLACLLAVTTKEVAVSVPLLVLLYDRTLVVDSFAEAWRQRRTMYVGLFLTWAMLAWMIMGAENRAGTAGFGTASSWHYLLTQCRAIVLYLKLAVWPHPLSFDFGKPLIADPLKVWPQAVLLIVLAAMSGVAIWRRSAWGLVGFWFFAILAPTSSVVPVATQTMAEHRMYLPVLAVVVAAVMGTYLWLGRRSFLLWVVVAAIFGGMTVRRNNDYITELSIWETAAQAQPENPRAICNYGQSLYEIGRKDEGMAYYERALQLSPDYFEAHNNLGVGLLDKGRLDEAKMHFEEVTKLQPDYAEAYSNLGMIHYARGDLDNAFKYESQAVKLNPDYAEAHSNLGIILHALGRFEEAASHCRKAIELKPKYAEAHSNLGMSLQALGRSEEAMQSYGTALTIRPAFAEAHVNLAISLVAAGRTDEAAGHFNEALQLKPDHIGAHAHLAKIYAEKGRLAEAVPHYFEMARLSPETADFHYTLGNALLKLNRMQEAVAPCEEAVRLRPDHAEAHANLATALFFTGQPQAAVSHFEEAIRLRPDYTKAYYFLGNTLASLGRTAEARSRYEEALKINPNYGPARDGLARLPQ